MLNHGGEVNVMAKRTIAIVFPCNERQEAKIKAFRRLIDASLGEFTAYALDSEIEFQLEHWNKKRIKQLERLSQSIYNKSGDRPPARQ